MNLNLLKGKSKRTKLFTLITVLLIVFCIGVNFLLSYFGLKNSIYFDMTPEGFYTLSKTMKKECDSFFEKLEQKNSDKKIKVIFCTDPDYLEASRYARMPYFMALKMQSRYPDLFEVETVNAALNPTAVSQYKTTSLSKITASDIIVSYGDRYRVSSMNAFWAQGNSEDYYYNGEYRIVSLIQSVTAINMPVAYFITDHGESYYDTDNPESDMSLSTAVLFDLLTDAGLAVKHFKLSEAEAIPDDCALLIINNPRTDFTYDESKLNQFSYISDTEKIDRYLVKKQGAVAVALDYQISAQLPVLNTFLNEWGLKFSDSVLVDKESSLDGGAEGGTDLIANYSQDKDSYAYQIYGEFSDLSSAPITVIPNSGSIETSYKETVGDYEPGTVNVTRRYVSLLSTSDSATRHHKDAVTGEVFLDGEEGKYDIAALAIRNEVDIKDNVSVNSYIFCVNSPEFFSNSILGEASYANYEIVSAVIDNISRVDDFATSELGGSSQNSSSIGGKRSITMTMKEYDHTLYYNNAVFKENNGLSVASKVIITVLVSAIPLSMAIVGAVVIIKRKYL